MEWNPKTYGKFESERARPCQDLIARIPSIKPRRIVDLGCGSGLSTAALAERYPEVQVFGLDNSSDMLEAAKMRLPSVQYIHGDVAQFHDPLADLLFANAVFHWTPDHVGLMGRLASELPAGGCLAAQMPDNEQEPSHALMRDVAGRREFAGLLSAAARRRSAVASFSEYANALAAHCDVVDIWRTIYVHRLPSADAIVAFVEGAGLRPFLDPLSPEAREEYLALYREAITRAYPVQPWGGVLFPFPRLFIVAVRKAD